MTEDRKKVSTKQLRILVEEVEKDPALLTGRPIGRCITLGKQRYNEKWEALAKKLNSVENGTLKSVGKWQQSLRDWKSNTKRKAAKLMKDQVHDGDHTQQLSNLELRLLNLYDEEPPPKKPCGIDISNIAELDPLSSDDDNTDEYKLSYDKDPTYTPLELLNFNERMKSETYSSWKNSSREGDKDVLSRLAALEDSRQEIDTRHIESIEALTAAMEKQAAAVSKQADAIQAQTRALDRLIEILGKRETD